MIDRRGGLEPPIDRTGGRNSETVRPPKLSTRMLLICGAFGALGTVLMLTVSPLTSAIAAWFPPAYAVVAGIHSILPFLARRLLGVPFAATIAAGLEGLLSSSFTPLGVLIVVPLVVSAVTFDLVLVAWKARASSVGTTAYLVAAASSAVCLFAVSLPVMNPERLTIWMLGAILIGRLTGQLLALGAATGIARRVFASGIMRPYSER